MNPLPSLQSAVSNAISFTKRFPLISVRLYEVRKAGTGCILTFEPFVVGEPQQGYKGLVYALLGSIKAGHVIS